MTVTIYGFPLSTYVRTARMACIEKGIDYVLEPVAPSASKERGLHPFGKIPVLDHDGFRLYETRAITGYIDAGFDGPALQPADAKARALMDQWISALNDVMYGTMIRGFVLPYVFAKDGQPDRAVIDAALPQIAHQLDVLNEGYGARAYLVGDGVTLADLFLAPVLYYVGAMPEGDSLLAKAPGVRRGIEAMHARRSFRETVPPQPG